MAGNDVFLLCDADELRQQDQPRQQRDARQRQEIGEAATHGMPQLLEGPLRAQVEDDDDPARDVHREDADQSKHCHRDAIPVPQRRGHQHHGRHRDPVGGQVRHRGDAELDVGHRGERRRQSRRGGGGSGGAPLAGARPEEMPGQNGRAGREQPDRRRDRIQGVTGGGCRSGELAEHRRQGVEHRRVVKGPVCLDVAKLPHVRGRRLAGVEDPAHGVGVPDGVPGAGNGLPVH